MNFRTGALVAAMVVATCLAGPALADGNYTINTSAPTATYQWQNSANWTIVGNSDSNNAFYPGRDANYSDAVFVNFGTATPGAANTPTIDLQNGVYLLNSLTITEGPHNNDGRFSYGTLKVANITYGTGNRSLNFDANTVVDAESRLLTVTNNSTGNLYFRGVTKGTGGLTIDGSRYTEFEVSWAGGGVGGDPNRWQMRGGITKAGTGETKFWDFVTGQFITFDSYTVNGTGKLNIDSGSGNPATTGWFGINVTGTTTINASQMTLRSEDSNGTFNLLGPVALNRSGQGTKITLETNANQKYVVLNIRGGLTDANVNFADTLTLDGGTVTVSGTGASRTGDTVIQPGTVNLNTSNALSTTGAVAVTAGSVYLNAPSAGTGSGAWTINGGIAFAAATNAFGTGSVTFSATGRASIDDANAFNSTTQQVTLTPGTLAVAGGYLWLRDPNHALNPFPTISVGAFAAIGGNLGGAVYTGDGNNLRLAPDAVILDGSTNLPNRTALGMSTSDSPFLWKGPSSNSGTWTVGDNGDPTDGNNIFKGAAFGDTWIPAAGGSFGGTIIAADPNRPLEIYLGMTKTFGGTRGVANLLTSEPNQGVIVRGGGRMILDANGGYGPRAVNAPLISRVGDPTFQNTILVTLYDANAIGVNQTVRITDGIVATDPNNLTSNQYQVIGGTLRVGSGATFIQDSNTAGGGYRGLTKGTLIIENEGAMRVNDVRQLVGGARVTFETGSKMIIEANLAMVPLSDPNWSWKPYPDYIVGRILSIGGSGVVLGQDRRITTSWGNSATLMANVGITTDANVTSVILSAFNGKTLTIQDNVTTDANVQIGNNAPYNVMAGVSSTFNRITSSDANGLVYLVGTNTSLGDVKVVSGKFYVNDANGDFFRARSLELSSISTYTGSYPNAEFDNGTVQITNDIVVNSGRLDIKGDKGNLAIALGNGDLARSIIVNGGANGMAWLDLEIVDGNALPAGGLAVINEPLVFSGRYGYVGDSLLVTRGVDGNVLLNSVTLRDGTQFSAKRSKVGVLRANFYIDGNAAIYKSNSGQSTEINNLQPTDPNNRVVVNLGGTGSDPNTNQQLIAQVWGAIRPGVTVNVNNAILRFLGVSSVEPNVVMNVNNGYIESWANLGGLTINATAVNPVSPGVRLYYNYDGNATPMDANTVINLGGGQDLRTYVLDANTLTNPTPPSQFVNRNDATINIVAGPGVGTLSVGRQGSDLNLNGKAWYTNVTIQDGAVLNLVSGDTDYVQADLKLPAGDAWVLNNSSDTNLSLGTVAGDAGGSTLHIDGSKQTTLGGLLTNTTVRVNTNSGGVGGARLVRSFIEANNTNPFVVEDGGRIVVALAYDANFTRWNIDNLIIIENGATGAHSLASTRTAGASTVNVTFNNVLLRDGAILSMDEDNSDNRASVTVEGNAFLSLKAGTAADPYDLINLVSTDANVRHTVSLVRGLGRGFFSYNVYGRVADEITVNMLQSGMVFQPGSRIEANTLIIDRGLSSADPNYDGFVDIYPGAGGDANESFTRGTVILSNNQDIKGRMFEANAWESTYVNRISTMIIVEKGADPAGDATFQGERAGADNTYDGFVMFKNVILREGTTINVARVNGCVLVDLFLDGNATAKIGGGTTQFLGNITANDPNGATLTIAGANDWTILGKLTNVDLIITNTNANGALSDRSYGRVTVQEVPLPDYSGFDLNGRNIDILAGTTKLSVDPNAGNIRVRNAALELYAASRQLNFDPNGWGGNLNIEMSGKAILRGKIDEPNDTPGVYNLYGYRTARYNGSLTVRNSNPNPLNPLDPNHTPTIIGSRNQDTPGVARYFFPNIVLEPNVGVILGRDNADGWGNFTLQGDAYFTGSAGDYFQIGDVSSSDPNCERTLMVTGNSASYEWRGTLYNVNLVANGGKVYRMRGPIGDPNIEQVYGTGFRLNGNTLTIINPGQYPVELWAGSGDPGPGNIIMTGGRGTTTAQSFALRGWNADGVELWGISPDTNIVMQNNASFRVSVADANSLAAQRFNRIGAPIRVIADADGNTTDATLRVERFTNATLADGPILTTDVVPGIVRFTNVLPDAGATVRLETDGTSALGIADFFLSGDLKIYSTNANLQLGDFLSIDPNLGYTVTVGGSSGARAIGRLQGTNRLKLFQMGGGFAMQYGFTMESGGVVELASALGAAFYDTLFTEPNRGTVEITGRGSWLNLRYGQGGRVWGDGLTINARAGTRIVGFVDDTGGDSNVVPTLVNAIQARVNILAPAGDPNDYVTLQADVSDPTYGGAPRDPNNPAGTVRFQNVYVADGRTVVLSSLNSKDVILDKLYLGGAAFVQAALDDPNIPWVHQFVRDVSGDPNLSCTLTVAGEWKSVRMIGQVSDADLIVTNTATTYLQSGFGSSFDLAGGRLDIQAGIVKMLDSAGFSGGVTIRVGGGATFDVSGVSFTLGSGQTLTGPGTVVGDVTIGDGAYLRPGDSPGTITMEGLLFEPNSHYVVDIDTETYDQTHVLSGNVVLGGWLDINTIGDPNVDMKMWIIRNDGPGTLSGAFDNYSNGDTVFVSGGFQWMIFYNADYDTGNLGGGNDVVLQIPEPATMGLVALGAVLTILRRRRK